MILPWVSQSLYSLSLFSRAGREAAQDGDMARLEASLAEMERNTLAALREMRLLLYQLRPAGLHQGGLIEAVKLRLNMVEKRVGLKVDLDYDSNLNVPWDIETELYHIIIEAMNNVVKHSAATRIGLHIHNENGSLNLSIIDDGRGFDIAQRGGGMGLDNIRERVNRLNGDLSITSKPGEGTQLKATIPCP
jgi:signal transduction histidine kinase